MSTLAFEEFFNTSSPPYAILSHTWGLAKEELTLSDIESKHLPRGVGYEKLQGCCRQAEKDGLEYVWIDTCCIDKDKLSELSEAINSMFQFYRDADICYAYLSDVPHGDNPGDVGSQFPSSRWFKRGWTLQELLAPSKVRFFNSRWEPLGTKSDLYSLISDITRIPSRILLGVESMHDATVAQRMSWAADRVTTRAEDKAYCLLGIFGVMMPLIYGERDEAFGRLQIEIVKKAWDDSIFAWGSGHHGTTSCSVAR